MIGDGFGLWDSVEIHGDWNIPGMDKVSGTLFYSPSDGLKLKLKSYLNLQEHEYSREHTKEIKIVQGIDIHGEQYTLHNVQLGGPSVERIGERPGLYQYHGESLFIGKKYMSEEELAFASIMMNMEGLEYWFGHKFFTQLPPGNYKIEPKRSEAFPIPELDAVVHIGATLSLKGCGIKFKNVVQENGLQLSPSSMQSLDWYDKHFWHLFNLLPLRDSTPCTLVGQRG